MTTQTTIQTKNKTLWEKLFIELGAEGIKEKTSTAIKTLYRIKKDDGYIPPPCVQRKLSEGLEIAIGELFPYTQ